jgi:hypothetical protein
MPADRAWTESWVRFAVMAGLVWLICADYREWMGGFIAVRPLNAAIFALVRSRQFAALGLNPD